MIPGLGRSPGRGNGNPLEYSCLENSMDRATPRATVWVTKGQIRLSYEHTHTMYNLHLLNRVYLKYNLTSFDTGVNL